MMGVHGEALRAAKRRKRTAKKRKRDQLVHSTQVTPLQPQTQGVVNDMEEIHLKRRVLDPSSELLLTWWDETKNQQEGLLISCKCNNNCTTTNATSGLPIVSSASTVTNNNDTEGSVLLREKLNIRSPPYVSNMMDTSYSGVALYNEANGLTVSGGTSNVSTTSRLANIRPKGAAQRASQVAVDMADLPVVSRHDHNWRNKRPYPCDYCAKPFRTSYEKRRHEMIHTGDRPWKCTECNKSFVDRACLRNHMRKRHVGEKPYKCAFCDITFFDTMNRAKHERTHEERLKAAKAEMSVKREMTVSGGILQEDDPSMAIVQVGDQLRQELIDTSVELEVGNGIEGEDPVLIKQEPDNRSSSPNKNGQLEEKLDSNGVDTDGTSQPPGEGVIDMADVFNITVIPDTVTIADTDQTKS